MRAWSICLMLSVLCLGCNRAEEARLKAVENNLKQIKLALRNYHEKYKSPVSELSHVIAAETEYYTPARNKADRQTASSRPAQKSALPRMQAATCWCDLMAVSRHTSLPMPSNNRRTSPWMCLQS